MPKKFVLLVSCCLGSIWSQDSFVDVKISGIVPDTARFATMGLRANIEQEYCPGCVSGTFDIVLTQISYTESGGPNRFGDPGFNNFGTSCLVFGNGVQSQSPVVTIEQVTDAGRQIHFRGPNPVGLNCPSTGNDFPVTPGAAYTATFRARVSRSSAATGYFAVFFLPQKTPCNCGSGRDVLPFQSTITGLALSQNGFTINAVAGGGTPPSRSLTVLNGTDKTLPFNATVTTTAGGPWLSVVPSTGNLNPLQLPPAVQVKANPGSLAAGEYYGQIRVDAPGAPNTPQFASVVLNVSPATVNPGPIVEPTGLVFVTAPGTTDPPAQTVLISNLTNRPSSFGISSVFTGSPNAWFTFSPVVGTVNPNQPVSITVQPKIAGLTPGVYRGTLNLTFPQDNATRSVDLLMVISPGSATAKDIRDVTAPSCVPSKLLPVFTLLGSNFTVLTGWPSPIEVKVVDDCGGLLTKGINTVSFSNGDSPIGLLPLGDGRWSGTWGPANAVTATLRLTATAATADLKLRGQVTLGGKLNDNPGVPVLSNGGVVNSGSFAPSASPSPGELVSIFGLNLADSLAVATTLPLATELNGVSVLLGDKLLPLIAVSSGQINAVIPYDVAPGSSQQIVVSKNTRLALPQTIQITPAEPAIFTTDASGSGQGHIYVIGPDGSQTLADAKNPARPGDAIVMYCSGLGRVTPAATAGASTPVDTLRETENQATVTIGGQTARVFFAGLTPGAAGLYQVNAYVPDNAGPGNTLPVVLTIGQFGGPPVTMAVGTPR